MCIRDSQGRKADLRLFPGRRYIPENRCDHAGLYASDEEVHEQPDRPDPYLWYGG